jgi:purine operon repressor
MERIQRNERMAIITKLLVDNPGRLFTLGGFSEQLNTVKSSISEDIDAINNILERQGEGFLETVPGAAGGVRFVPNVKSCKVKEYIDKMIKELSNPERILTGGYLYLNDIIYNPERVYRIAEIFATKFSIKKPDLVITVETKGIPLAFAVARLLAIPLVVARRKSDAAEGHSVNINYVSGSSKQLQTMVLPIKALKRGSRILFIDDFIKGGGTARGIEELAREFDCSVVGNGFLIETMNPEKKLVNECYSLIKIGEINEQRGVLQISSGIY